MCAMYRRLCTDISIIYAVKRMCEIQIRCNHKQKKVMLIYGKPVQQRPEMGISVRWAFQCMYIFHTQKYVHMRIYERTHMKNTHKLIALFMHL